MSRSQVLRPMFVRSLPTAIRWLVLAAAFAILLMIPAVNARAQAGGNGDDKHVDIRTPVGDMHAGTDADARQIGLPIYPGARPKHDENGKNSANLGIFTEAFGLKLLVVNYESDASPSRLIAYYREKLAKYGPVLECHTSAHADDVQLSHDEHDANALKCDPNDDGKTVELKAGTKDNARVVGIEPSETGKGATFALVYVRTRGKQGDI